MAKFNPYLIFQGNAEEAFNFYKSVFGGEFAAMSRFGDTPEAGKIAEADKKKIMHVALPLGGDTVLMGSDTIEGMGHKLQVGNNFYISVNIDSRKDADKMFNALSTGGKAEMPMADTFWGDYFGMCEDRFNIHWMISFHKAGPQV